MGDAPVHDSRDIHIINPLDSTKKVSVVTDGATERLAVDGTFSASIASDMEGGGSGTVGTTAIEVTFTAATKTILISAGTINAGILYLGKSDVTSAGANAIAFLDAGEKIVLDYDDATNALFIVATLNTPMQEFFKGALF